MSLFSYPAKFTTGSDGRVLVEFIDLPRVATDGMASLRRIFGLASVAPR